MNPTTSIPLMHSLTKWHQENLGTSFCNGINADDRKVDSFLKLSMDSFHYLLLVKLLNFQLRIYVSFVRSKWGKDDWSNLWIWKCQYWQSDFKNIFGFFSKECAISYGWKRTYKFPIIWLESILPEIIYFSKVQTM